MPADQFRTWSALLSEAVLLVAKDGRILSANEAIRQLGFDPRRIEQQTLFDISATPEADIREFLRRSSRTRQPLFTAITLRDALGEEMACRCDGMLAQHQSEGGETLLLLKLTPKQASVHQYQLVNEKIGELNREIQWRIALERELQERNEYLQVTLTSIGDGVIVTDVLGRVTLMNSVAEELTGWTTEAAIGNPLEDVFHIVNETTRRAVENPARRALRDGKIVGLANHTVLISKDGTEHPIDDSAAPINSKEGEVVGCVLVFRDISARRQVERYRTVRHEVTQVLTTVSTRRQAIQGVLKAIGRNMNWHLGFFWTVNTQSEELICQETYTHPDAQATTFQLASRKTRFKRGEGLPGSVWAKCEPVWIPDVTQQSYFRRAASAAEDGLHSAFACPVVVGRQVLGIIEFFTHKIKEPDADLLDLSETVSGHLGQFIERKLAENELEQRVEELTDFFQNATIGLHWVGPDEKVLRVNQAELDLLGYTEDEYVGRCIREFHADEDVIGDILARLKAGDNLRDYPARLVCKDGTIKEVLIDSSVMWQDGQFVHTRCFTRDVTDRNRAEANLRIQEERIRNILESITDAFFAVDRQWRFTYVNSQAARLLELEPGDLMGQVIWEAFPGLRDSDFEQAYRESLLKQRPLSMTSYYPDHKRWYEAHVYPAQEGISVYFRDVSERKRSEAILAAQKRALELSMNQAPLSDVLNALCEVIEGQSQQEIIATVLLLDEDGQHLRSAAGPRAPAAYAQAVDGVAIGPRVGSCGTAAFRAEQVIVSDIETDPLWDDFRELALSHGLRACWSTPIFSSENRVLGTFAVYALTPGQPTSDQLSLMDVLARTAGIAVERRRNEEALRMADRRKDEFLATLAHELRNPLAPIRTGLEVMKLSRDDPETIEDIRQTMERQTQQLIALVDDLLDVSRITRGKFELKKCPVQLTDVIQSAIEASKPFIDDAGHELSITMTERPVYLNADPHRLAQVVSNLLNNAAKYTPDGGHIRLTVTCQNQHVVIAVTDNGIGIPPEMREKIFEMFAQIDQPAEKAYAGLGIGLTLVKSLVEMHGGQVTAESDGCNQGSTFRVRLPILKKRPKVEQDLPEVTAPTKQCRVLIVDDNQAAAKLLAMVVKALGNEVRGAGDGQEAIEVAAAFRPHLILMDIGMPKMNGYDAAKHIRQQPWGQDITLVALTGWGQDKDKQKTKEAGFDQHLTKPARPADLRKLFSELGQDCKKSTSETNSPH